MVMPEVQGGETYGAICLTYGMFGSCIEGPFACRFPLRRPPPPLSSETHLVQWGYNVRGESTQPVCPSSIFLYDV